MNEYTDFQIINFDSAQILILEIDSEIFNQNSHEKYLILEKSNGGFISEIKHPTAKINYLKMAGFIKT